MLPEFKIDHVEKTARNRSIIISKPIATKITYFGDGQGYESVRVNDITKNATRSSFKSSKKIPFMISIDGKFHPAYIEVQLSWFKIVRFRLVIENTILYSEGDFNTPHSPAIAVDEADFGYLDRKKPTKEELIFIVLFLCISVLVIFPFRIETEWNVPYKIAFKYLAGPITLISAFVALKFPKFMDRLLRGPYLLFSESKKIAFRVGFSLCFSLMFVGYSGAIISGLNAYVKPGTQTMIKGTIESTFESTNNVIAKIKTTERTLEIPIDLCIGRSTEPGDKFETAMAMGALGFYYLPKNEYDRSSLNVFFVENLTDGRWVRQDNIHSATKIKGLDWLKNLFTKWSAECDSGNAASCRLASYYFEELKAPQQKDFLIKSCNGNDPVGCYGLSLIDSTTKEEKTNAVSKIFDMCRTHQPTCRCYWDEFKKYLDPKAVGERKTELCKSGQKWAC